MSTFPIRDILKSLSVTRPVFHSEADFQFSLSWKIKELFPEADIRLEIPFGKKKKEYLDILVKLKDEVIPIELKYKTKKTKLIHDNEYFYLKNHGAYNVNRYAILKDVERIERFIEENNCSQGYSIILSNDSTYWNLNDKDTLDKEFSIQEGKLITGKLQWTEIVKETYIRKTG